MCRFYVDYENTDPWKLFAVTKETGLVTLRHSLDYDTRTEHTVHILAIDEGEASKTDTGTMPSVGL